MLDVYPFNFINSGGKKEDLVKKASLKNDLLPKSDKKIAESHVFISYSILDRDFTNNVKNEIKKAGINTWMSEHALVPGQDWSSKIDQAIKDALALIVIMTPDAKDSEYVTYEWSFAIGAGIPVIPILRKTIEGGLHPRLQRLQYLDCTQNYQWDKLIQTIKEKAQFVPAYVARSISALDSHNPSDRKEAIETLKNTSHPAALSALIKALKHDLWDVQVEAAIAVGQYKENHERPEFVSALIESLNQENNEWHSKFSKIFIKVGKPLIPKLIDCLGKENYHVRANAALALGKMGDNSSVMGLLKCLSDKRPEVRIHAAQALGQIKDSKAVPMLINKLSDKETARLCFEDKDGQTVFGNKTIAETSSQALKRIGTPEALEAIQRPGKGIKKKQNEKNC